MRSRIVKAHRVTYPDGYQVIDGAVYENGRALTADEAIEWSRHSGIGICGPFSPLIGGLGSFAVAAGLIGRDALDGQEPTGSRF